MSVSVKHYLLTIFLISVLNIHCSEGSKLFNISEEAIITGREILREVEKADPRNTELSTVAGKVIDVIRKFHDKHNNHLRFSYLNTWIAEEFKSKTLIKNFNQLEGFSVKFAPEHLMRVIGGYDYFVTNILKGNATGIDVPGLLPSIYYPSGSYIEENVFDFHEVEIAYTFPKDMVQLLLKKDPDTGYSIMDILTKQSSNWLCWSSSRQQILYSILDYITTIDTIRYVLTQHYLAAFKMYYEVPEKLSKEDVRDLEMIRSTWTEKDVIKRMKNLENEFIERNSRALVIFAQAMAGQSREASSCGENNREYRDEIKRQYTTKLENLFHMYIANEVDLNEKGTCKKECTDYRQTKQYGCYDGGVCKRQRTYIGTLWNCGTEIDSTMNICLGNEDETQRYNFIQAGDKTYGNELSYCNEQVLAKTWPRGFYKCTYCTCTCEEMTDESDRYFNLRPVQSEIESNYVITNALFTKLSNIVYIQIEEGQLLNNGYINASSLRWKEIENYTIYDDDVKGSDYRTITWNRRNVYLGDLDSPLDSVLTGLKFSPVYDGIKLEMGYTAFDFTTGKLANTIQWISHPDYAPQWTEIKFENKDGIVKDTRNTYIKFTTNDLKIDAGQSTIPYLDSDEVITNTFKVPLSGVGLFAKNKKDVGSYLALKFRTYDFVNNM